MLNPPKNGPAMGVGGEALKGWWHPFPNSLLFSFHFSYLKTALKSMYKK
jgi:hypothetical protein